MERVVQRGNPVIILQACIVTVAMQCCNIDKAFVVTTSYFEAMIISPLGFQFSMKRSLS